MTDPSRENGSPGTNRKSPSSEQLRGCHERFQKLFEQSGDGIFLHDLEGLLLDVNDRGAQMLELPREELIGKPLYALHPPEDLAEAHAAFGRLLQEGFVRFRTRFTTGTGRILNVDAATAIVETAEFSFFQVVVRDITARVQAEEGLRQFKLSVENSSDAVGMSTPDGRHYYQNRAFDELFGDIGEDPRATLYLDPAVGREVFGTIRAGGQWTGEVEMRARDGRVLTILLRAYASLGPAGRIEALVGVHTDITAQKRLEQERRELDARLHQMQRLQSLGVLAGGIAHDFNNILMAILGHSELVLEDLGPTALARESVQEIRTAALGAAELCTQMLAYSGRGRLEKRDFCLGQLVEELVHMLRASVSKKSALHLDIAKPLPLMRGDASQLRQVILNLVINASEALGDHDGSITVTTGVMDCQADQLAQGYVVPLATPGPYVFVEVSDTGCGMSEETIRRMFEPFFTTKFTGRGLGLSAVLGIVQAHGGALRVQSALDHGTTIRAQFPAIGPAVAENKSVSSGPGPAGQGTVLVVDDEAAVLAVTSKMLRRLGFEVLQARDGMEALEMYREHRLGISLVLMDLTMPRMSGEEAFSELRKLDPGVRVVLASGYDEHDLAARFAGRGLAGSIQKPYTLDKLGAVLRTLLQVAD